MNIKETEENTKLLQLQKSVDEAQKILSDLKKEGYDKHSTAVINAGKILEIRLKILNGAK